MRPRLALAQEAEAITRLIDAAYLVYRDQGIALPDVSGGVAEAISAGQVWVVGKDDLLGVLMLTCTPPQAHLMNVAVAPSGRGTGLGGLLIRHALRLAAQAGCHEMALATHRDLSDTLALYHHLGWRETERAGMRVLMTRAIEANLTP